jgi:hypothetical protein
MRASLAIPLSFLFTPLLAAAGEIDFQRDIQPIFSEYCLECHGMDKAKGGLALTTRAGALKELESGAYGVVPGKVEESELITRLTTTEEDAVMPPKKKPKRPSARQIELLQKWVASGAEWGVHWSYRPITRPELPAGQDANPIDHFIHAKLAEKKITPSAEADRFTLIKRASYDLLGLPPTPEETDAFIRDDAPDAYVRMIERTLASPHFGERWGRHWLDQARYADSDGYEKDSARPDAWRYRDWVIDAINRDLPFDQFTIEQLAGDLLPNPTPEQILATAFHRQTLTNREGGVDQEQYRVEAIFDRTETTGSVWLAHTVGCARCHSHKYDQLSQREYYQLFSFFNNADEANTKVGISREALAEYELKNEQLAPKLRALREKLAAARAPFLDLLPAWEKEITARLAALGNRAAQAQPLDVQSVTSAGQVEFAQLDDDSLLAGGPQAPSDTYTVVAKLPAGLISGLRLEVLPDESLPGKGPGRSKDGNFVLSEIVVRPGADAAGAPLEMHSPKADFSQEGWSVAAALDGKPDTGWAISGQQGKAHNATFQFVRPIDSAETSRITITLVQQYPKKDHAIGRFRLVALVGETAESIVPAAVKSLVNIGSEKWTDDGRETIVDWLARSDPAATAAAAELAAAEASGPKPPLMDVRVLAQRKQERATRVLHRGEFLSPTDPVQPSTPAILPPIHARNGGPPDRLDLARWLVNGENPLTARVIVNQIWMRLFGDGLVRTVEDFGVRGERPSHPELLDWLASEFMEHGWSRKHVIRLIMNSATYRQRSETRPELNEIDPRNTLLARQNRLRAEGEIVRDLHLATSGLLSPKVGGPSVFPPMPPEIASLSYAGNFKWNESKGEDRYRRGMYTFFKRTAPYPDLMTFDCPDANVANVRRTVSNTPLQALTTLNAKTFAEAARALAQRVLREPCADDRARMAWAFRICLARPPQEKETNVLLGLLQDARDYYSTHEDDAKRASDDAESAAWTTTARILLNTDEFITRD